MDREKFLKGVERLVNPIDVGTLHFIQSFNSLLPKSIQEKLITSSAQKAPYMGFVVEPYSLFLCYEIADVEQAKKLLPDGFKLIETKIFAEDEPKYYCIFGCFTAHTSAFWGSRVEFYVIAEDQQTKLLSWIIVDYDSNTISYDKKDGLRAANASGAISVNHQGTLYVDFQKDDGSRGIRLDTQVERGNSLPLDQRLWLEGNLSIGYGRNFGSDASIFSLKFDPAEVEKARNIPLSDVNIELNNWYPGLFKDIPAKVVCFPYAQHYISDSPGASSKVMNEQELIKAIEGIDFEHMQVFSTKSFKTMFMVGSGVSLLIILILLILLILK